MRPKGKPCGIEQAMIPTKRGGIGGAAFRAQTSRGWLGGDDPHIGEIRLSSLSPSVETALKGREPSQAKGTTCENRRG